MIRLYCTEDLSSGLIMNPVGAFDRLFRRFQFMFGRLLSLDNGTKNFPQCIILRFLGMLNQ